MGRVCEPHTEQTYTRPWDRTQDLHAVRQQCDPLLHHATPRTMDHQIFYVFNQTNLCSFIYLSIIGI